MKPHLSLVLLSLWCAGVQAQGPRDPTVVPAEALPVDATSTEKSGTAGRPGMTVVVRQGQAFLASGNRLYARGQKMGNARIERISETEIWFREAGVLRKVPLFAGIQRRVVVPQESPAAVRCKGVKAKCATP